MHPLSNEATVADKMRLNKAHHEAVQRAQKAFDEAPPAERPTAALFLQQSREALRSLRATLPRPRLVVG